MDEGQRWWVRLIHEGTGREVPVETQTVFGRNETYYRYKGEDSCGDRLGEVADRLAGLDFVTIEADKSVSRTHGLLDPRRPGLSDLNSTNGTLLNGDVLSTNYGRVGPMQTLSDGDRIQVGGQRFHVRTRATTLKSICAQVARQRLAVVACGPDTLERGQRVRAFVEGRKRFHAHLTTTLEDLRVAAFGLRDVAQEHSLVLFALCCAVEGDSLVLGSGEHIPAAAFLRFFRSVPGRKVLVLEGQGDPTAFEGQFAAQSCQDSILITSPGPVDLDESYVNTLLRPAVHDLRLSVSGEGQPGVCDDALDGLDALIPPDTNRLSTSWTSTYEGRLGIIYGTQQDPDSWINHSLRFGSSRFHFRQGA